jgi:hypothetical protein
MGLEYAELLESTAVREKAYKAVILQGGFIHGQSRDGGPLLRRCGLQELLPVFAAWRSLARESVQTERQKCGVCVKLAAS